MPRTFQHTTHNDDHGLGLTVADSSLLEYNSNSIGSSCTITKSNKHLKTLNGGVAHAAASPLSSSSSSSGYEAFDAVKDAERRAKNATSAQKSRKKKNMIEAKRDKQAEELEMKNQKLKEKVNISEFLLNAMSGLVLDTKLQNLYSDSTLHAATTTTPEHGSFHQQMEQETTATLVSFLPSINDVEEGTQEFGQFNLPYFLKANNTASQKEEEEDENNIKKADETKYSTEEVPQMHPNQSKQ